MLQVTRNKQFLLIFTVLLGISLILVSCGNDKRDLRTKPYVKEVFAMGTYIKITSYDKGHEKDIAAALDIAKDYDKKTSVNQSGSELDAVNDQAGIKPVKVSKKVYALLKSAYSYSEKENGFDMLIGALTSLWHRTD